jgi:hypothetical protein
MTKVKWLLVFAAGYVLGAAAGRRRYEQIKAAAQKVANDPHVRAASRKAQDTVAEQAPVVAEAVKDATVHAASTVAERVRGAHEPDDASPTADPAAASRPAPATGGPAIS